MRCLALLLCTSLLFSGAPALAESGFPSDPASPALWQSRPSAWILAQSPTGEAKGFDSVDQASTTAIDARIEEARSKRRSIDTQSPRTAVIVGGVFTGVGALVAIAAGLGCVSANDGSETKCRTDRANGIMIGGGALAAVGLTTLIAGLSTLSRRKNEERKYDLDIKKLEKEREGMVSRPTAEIRFGEAKTLTLSWTY